jgi:hypothetical protein
MQVGAVQREAGADITPQRGEVDVGQQATAVIAEALIRDQRSALGNRGLQAQSPQRPRRVARQVDACTSVRPGGFPLDHVGGESALSERSADAETGDAGADHENAQTGTISRGA